MVVNEQHFKSVQKVGFSQTLVFHLVHSAKYTAGIAIGTGLSLIHIYIYFFTVYFSLFICELCIDKK